MTVRRRLYQGAKGLSQAWVVDVDFCHPDGTRERVRRTSPVQTRRAAEQYDRDIRAELALKSMHVAARTQVTAIIDTAPPALPEPQTVNFTEFSADFLENYARTNNKPSEYDGKKRILETHLIPFFGQGNLQDISIRAIETYKAATIARNLSPKTVNNHLAVLGKMLRVAESWQLLLAGPKIRLLRVAQQERDFLSFEEADALIRGADPGLWRAMITTAVRTGLRLGELRALSAKDVDLERHQLHVRRAAWKDVVGTPKGGQHRVVDLSRQAEQAISKILSRGTGLVFAKSAGTMIPKESCKWPLWRACDRAGLGRRVGWHALRHTFASHLVSRGAPIKAVQELLGHADIKMTMRYAHLAPRDRSRAVSLLDEPCLES